MKTLLFRLVALAFIAVAQALPVHAQPFDPVTSKIFASKLPKGQKILQNGPGGSHLSEVLEATKLDATKISKFDRIAVLPSDIVDKPLARATIVEGFRKTLPSAAIAKDDAIVILPMVELLAADGQKIRVSIAAWADRKLTRSEDGTTFSGTLRVALQEYASDASPRELGSPVTVEIIEQSYAQPAKIATTRTGLLEQPFTVTTDQAMTPVKITLHSDASPEDKIVVVDVAPHIIMKPTTNTIEGLGLEAVNISIDAFGGDGLAGKTVTLHTDSGRFDKPTAKLDAQGHADVVLRSGSPGKTVVSAEIPSGPGDSQEFTFSFPVETLAAGLGGALVGALIVLLQARIARPRQGWKTPLIRFALSSIIGIVVLGLFLVGVNVLPVTPNVTSGALLMFVVAAVGAYLGEAVLPKPAPAGG